ncbi:hypothetical protein N9N28_14325 [Rubripirellula amarantea]|nr:hypothetical protein [Rubripirellula amarantea]
MKEAAMGWPVTLSLSSAGHQDFSKKQRDESDFQPFVTDSTIGRMFQQNPVTPRT